MEMKMFRKEKHGNRNVYKTYLGIFSWTLLFFLNVIILYVLFFDRIELSSNKIVFIALINFILIFLAAYNCIKQIKRIKR